MSDVDEVAIQRAIAGDRSVRLTPRELDAAFLYLNGHGYSTREIAARLGVADRTVNRWKAGENRPSCRSRTKAGGAVTGRLVDVLEGISDGLTDKQIGERLSISEHTVHSYVKRLFRLLNATDRADAVALSQAGENAAEGVA